MQQEFILQDHSENLEDLTITLARDNNVFTLRKHLFVELNQRRPETTWIPINSICMWVETSGNNKIRLITEQVWSEGKNVTPTEPPSIDTQFFEEDKPEIREGDYLGRPVLEAAPGHKIHYMLLGDYLNFLIQEDEDFQNFSESMPKNMDTLLEGDNDARNLWTDLISIAFPYWPVLCASNDGLEFTLLLYALRSNTDEIGKQTQKKLTLAQSNTRKQVSEYTEEFKISKPEKQLTESAKKFNKLVPDVEYQLTNALFEIQPKAGLDHQEFVNIPQLFYYVRLGPRNVLKATWIESKQKPLIAIYKKVRETESNEVIDRWVKKIKVKQGQMILRIKMPGDEKRYMTMQFMSDGRYVAACSWSTLDDRSTEDRVSECLTVASDIAQHLNEIKGKRPVFVTPDGLPAKKETHRYRVKLNVRNPKIVRIININAQLYLPINLTQAKLSKLIKSSRPKTTKEFFDSHVTVASVSGSKNVTLKYIKNDTEPVSVIINTNTSGKAAEQSRVVIRKAKGFIELEAIDKFIRAMTHMYMEKYKVQPPKEWSADIESLIKTTKDKGGSIYRLWKQGKITKLALLKYYDNQSEDLNLFETGSYVTECQRHRQPLILTDDEAGQLESQLKYVMQYRGYNFACNPKSDFPFPGLGKHNQRFIPCCFARNQRAKPVYQEHVEGNVNPDKITRIDFKVHTIVDDKKIISPGRTGKLQGAVRSGRNEPELLDRLFNGLVKNPAEFLRIGIQQDSMAFFRAVLALTDDKYFTIKDSKKTDTIIEFQNELIEEMTKHKQLFLSLNKGKIRDVYKTAKKFGKAIKNNQVTDHRELVDLIHKVKRVNIFIFEIILPETGHVTNVNLLCHMSETTFHEDFANLFLIHRDEAYEPIMLVDKKAKTVLQRTFAYNKTSTDSRGPANVVYDLWRSICIPETRFHLSDGFSRPLTANETKRTIRSNTDDIVIVGQMISGNYRCVSLALRYDKNKVSVVPVLPSDPLFDSRKQRQVPIVAGDRMQTPNQTRVGLNTIANMTGLNVRPRSQILDDNDKCVALYLENTLFAPTKPSAQLSNFPVEPSVRYYNNVDKYIRTGNQETDERILFARKQKKQIDFRYNLLIELALYFRKHSQDKEKVIQIVDSDESVASKKSQMHNILASVLNRILNRRKFAFPVNILGIKGLLNGNIYDIVSGSGKKTFKECETLNETNCEKERHCEFTENKCKNTAEQEVLSKYYFSILHEITTDPTHRLIEGQLGHILKLVEKIEHPNEEIIS